MLLLLCLVSGLLATASGLCASPFTEVGEGCYYFSQEHSLELTWESARTYCQSLGIGVDLAMLDYVCDDFRDIGYHLLVLSTFFTMAPTWIGASGDGNEWFWVDGRPLTLNSPYWWDPYPASNDGYAFLGFHHSEDMRVHLGAATVDSSHPFICQNYNAVTRH